MRTVLFADDTVLAQNDDNLEKLQKSVNCQTTKAMYWLATNIL